MAHSLTIIGVHLECAIQAEMVVELELVLIERKQSRKLRKGSKVCQGQRSCRAVSVLTSTYTQIFKKRVKVIERARDITPRSKYDKSKGHPSSPNLVQLV